MSFFQSNHSKDSERVRPRSDEAAILGPQAHAGEVGVSIGPTESMSAPSPELAPLSFDADAPAPDQCGLFIRPNEFNPQNFHAALLDRQGVYVGVGTFRALGAIGVGSFDYGILLDYDHGTVLFNKANLSLVCSSASRVEYLARLFRAPIDREGLNAIDASAESAACALGKPSTRLDDISEVRPRHIFSAKDLVEIREDFASPAQWRATIFGNDAIFERVKSMATAGRIVVGCGDFVNGAKALSSLSKALTERGLLISVVDLSNLAAHVDPDRAFAPNWSPDATSPAPLPQRDAWMRLSWNISRLPTTRDAVVLCTDFYTMPSCRPRFASWSYSSLALVEYASALREPGIDQAKSRLKDISNDSFINITRDLESPHIRRHSPDFMRAKSFT